MEKVTDKTISIPLEEKGEAFCESWQSPLPFLQLKEKNINTREVELTTQEIL